MESKKHKRKTSHVVIVTSDAVDANVKQFRIRPWVLWTAIVILSVVMGAGLGYIIYEDQIWSVANQRIDEHVAKEKELQLQLNQQKQEAEETQKLLQAEIDQLEKEKEILSDTVNIKDDEVKTAVGELEKLYNPTKLPLTGGATIEEITEGEPMCVFQATEGALVVATASGTVTDIFEDAENGFKVTIDHENGYVTVYQNTEAPKVKLGENVMQGMTIFVVDKSSLKLKYQVIKDENYINPMEIMEIEG